MYVRVVLHVVKPVVARHLLDLEGLRGQRPLLDRLELELLGGDVVQREDFLQLVPVLRVAHTLQIRIVGVRAVNRPRVRKFGRRRMPLRVVEKVLLVREDPVHVARIVFVLLPLIIQ